MIRAERDRRAKLKADKREQRSRDAELEFCASSPEGIIHWFDNYVWTFDPRLLGKKDDQGRPLSPYVPFVLWPKQRELIHFLWDRLQANEEWLLEKSRDTGATYVVAGFMLNRWLFGDGFKGTFGSRDLDLVDVAGDPDSIFEKMRIMLQRLPEWMLPEGFAFNRHSHSKRLINPAQGGTITGDGGKEMGRGGRSTMYCIDEAAFVPNAEDVERAVSGNTDCIGWISTPNGMGNLFARKRHSILKPHQIFRLHWRDDPRKTEEWAAAKKASMSDEASWASDFEIDYTASLEGVCIPAAWVQSAQRIGQLEPGVRRSNEDFTIGHDVGAGKARSVCVARRGPIVIRPISRGNPDTIGTANWALEYALDIQARILNFDSPGVGIGVQSALLHSANRPASLLVQPVNTGDAPSDTVWDDGRTSEEIAMNLKADIWWMARMRFKRTHEHLLWLEGKSAEDGAMQHRPSELVSLPSGDPESDKLAVELSVVRYFRNEKGKIKIESKEQLAKRGIKSPDYADAYVLTEIGDRGPGYSLDNL